MSGEDPGAGARQPDACVEGQGQGEVADCGRRGGHLASVHDEEDAKAVSELCRSHLGEGGGCWIGLSDQGHEGSFEWSDGSPLDFEDWNPGEG